jgi:hypothetical protein
MYSPIFSTNLSAQYDSGPEKIKRQSDILFNDFIFSHFRNPLIYLSLYHCQRSLMSCSAYCKASFKFAIERGCFDEGIHVRNHNGNLSPGAGNIGLILDHNFDDLALFRSDTNPQAVIAVNADGLYEFLTFQFH